MALMLRGADQHADRILDVVRNGLSEPDKDVVARSWSRCLNEYQLHPNKPRDPPVLERVALEDRIARRADVIECARYEMTTLYQQLADTESAVVLTDTDGVIVHMVASPEFAAEAAPLGLRCGGVWGENEAGTNGMGTCLAAGGPVSIRREDHFFSRLTQLTCSAVPVYDPAGEITAVLDVTSRSSLMQQHLLVLLGMTARMIENRLIDKQFRNAHPLHFHSRPEFVYTLHEGKLAVADDGRILAANRSALFQLGLQTMAEVRARRIEDLFQTSLEDMLQRSSSSSFPPRRDVPRQCRAAFLRRGPAASFRRCGLGPCDGVASGCHARPHGACGCGHPGCNAPARCAGAAPGGRRRHLQGPAAGGAPGNGTPRDRAAVAHPAVRRNRLGQGSLRPRRAQQQPARGGRLHRGELRQPA